MNIPQSNQENKEESISTQVRQNDDSDIKDRDVYFLILRPFEKKIDFTGLNYETKNKIEPNIVFQKRIDKEDNTYLEEIVFKFKKKAKKKESTKSTEYSITFF